MCKTLKHVFSKRNAVISLGILHFVLLAASFTIQAPIYPTLAESKGVPQEKYGFVFGTFAISQMILTLPLGMVISRLGALLVLMCGILLLGGSCLVFGFLAYISDPTTFLVYSFIIRIIESFGNCSISISVITILLIMYPDLEGAVTGWTEIGFALGTTLGPLIGGFLFDIGGFVVPFVFIGVLMLFSMIPSYGFFNADASDEKEGVKNQQTFFNIVKVPKVWLGVLVNGMGAITAESFLMPTLEPHMKQLSLSGTIVGTAFLCNGLGYVLSSPFWYYLSNKRKASPYLLMVASFVIMNLGMGMIGPIPWIPVKPQLWLIILGMLIIGLGMGGTFISVFNQMLNACTERKIPYSTETKSALAAIFQMSLGIGNCIGPSYAGIMASYVGFRMASLTIIGINILVILVLLPFLRGDSKI